MAKVSLGRDDSGDKGEKPADVPEVSKEDRARIAAGAEVQTAKPAKPERAEIPKPGAGLDDERFAKGFALRLTEKLDAEVKYIAQHTEYSANSLINEAVRVFVKSVMQAARRRHREKLEG